MKIVSILAGVGCAAVTSLAPAQTLVGRPCLFNEYFPEWRCFPAILRDSEGNLTCGRNRLNQGGVTLAPLAAGPISVTSVFRGPNHPVPQFHFAYRDQDGGVQDLWHTRKGEMDQWHFQKLNGGAVTQAPAAVGNPSGCFHGNRYHVVYRSQDGGLWDLSWDGAWHGEAMNAGGAASAPPAAGDPVQMELQGRRHVLYRDRDGGLQDLWFENGWHLRQLNHGGLTQAPAAEGEPAGQDFQKGVLVVYRDGEGEIQELSYDGAWQVQQLTGGGRTDAPPAAGDPSLTTLGGRICHVTYRDRAGELQDLWFDGQWHRETLTGGGATDAPPAASDPVLLAPPSNWMFVGYVDIHGAGQLLTRPPGKSWRVSPLNADTPPGGATVPY